MSAIKKNIKLVLVVLMLIVISSGVSVYATAQYYATQVQYKDGKSVANALDELYANKKETTDTTYEITANNTYSLDKYYKNILVNVESGNTDYETFNTDGFIRINKLDFYSKTISVPAGKTKVIIFSDVSSTWGVAEPTIANSNIITSTNITRLNSGFRSGKIAEECYLSIIDTNGNAGEITITFNGAGDDGYTYNLVNALVLYK